MLSVSPLPLSSKKTKKSQFHSGKWTKEEDKLLLYYINIFGSTHWTKISDKLQTRSPVQCLHRWSKILKPGLKKGTWTIEEDRKLFNWIKEKGPNNWSNCSEYLKVRTGQQCRERWFNSLHPGLKKGRWNPEEDLIIFEKYKIYGTKWSKISSFLPGRAEGSVKNRFYSTLRRIAYKYEKHPQNQDGNLISTKNISNNQSNNSPYPSKSSLSFLVNFIDKAYEEKKRIFEKMNKKDNDLISSHEAKCNNPKSNGDTQKIETPKDNHTFLKDTLETESEQMNYSTSQMDFFESEAGKTQNKEDTMVKNYIDNICNETSKKKTNSLVSDLNELEYNLNTSKYLLNNKRNNNNNNNSPKTNSIDSNLISCNQNEFDSLSSSSSYLPLVF